MFSKVHAAAQTHADAAPTSGVAWTERQPEEPPIQKCAGSVASARSVPERLLLGLLRLLALTGDAGWWSQLLAALVHALYTAGATLAATISLRDVTLRLQHDTVILSLCLTSCGGFVFVLMWIPLGIGVLLLTIHAIGSGTDIVLTSVILCYIVIMFVALVLPSEVVQWVLDTVGKTRNLLLKPQLQLPALQPELGLFRETVGRDLDTLGDLGLFRLQRSTVLSILATILTYVIVMLQFHISELTPCGGNQTKAF
ncbi:hypothetical protein FJT64_017772 [Amphibalanus amphitrite]|uniref:Gustatory receptor n=1 Tax=Amphibalanus amphitrite TaxID=1232801 RepID=A0A6A4WWX6_AMPAM|nr:hypothetical protein FJT64_017772 [Amphibalanus amphitrite]